MSSTPQSNKFDEIKSDLKGEFSKKNSKPLDSYNKTSKEKVLWDCKSCGDIYEAQVRKRVYDKSSCPHCARKRSKVPLSKQFPNLVLDYDHMKNDKPLDYFSRGSQSRVWWKCNICTFEWETEIKQRATRGHGCSSCKTRKMNDARITDLLATKGSLADNAPDIAAQWDYEKNDKPPSQYLAGSGKSVYWKCAYGHTWKTSINSRVSNNNGCRYCGNQNSQYEMRLFSELKIFDKNIKWNSRINGSECDLFLPRFNLAIEIDGYPWHDTDESRQRDLMKAKKLLEVSKKWFKLMS